jgi:2-polyprenyl-3-methyl-5-hydroxy-6-metoxy-1,4-benzoquinol methylase
MDFTNSLPKLRVVRRNEYFISKCNAKKDLHLGAVDYINGGFCGLHRALTNVADSVTGLDIDETGIKRARAEGIQNIHYGNLEELDKVDIQDRFDIIAAGGVIEHLSNPGLFLDGVKRFFAPHGEMIIETPNAFSFHRFFLALARIEYVHPEHICYYSYVTLRNLLNIHDYIITEELSHILGARLASLRMFIARLNFNFANGFIFVVKKDK